MVIPARADTPSPITHVVIIDQENHSFDNVLGSFCHRVRLGLIDRASTCRGATKGTTYNGTVIPLAEAPDLVPRVNHDVASQTHSIRHGLMNGFSRISGCTKDEGYACYSQFRPRQIPNVTKLAISYAVSDATFSYASTPSWGSHISMVAATMDGFSGDNPTRSLYSSTAGMGWGCDSYRDAPWWDGSAWVMEPSCIPDQAGRGPYRDSPVPYTPTIFDRLDGKGLSWRIYGATGKPGDPVASGWGWVICPTFYGCASTAQADNLVPATDILTDAATGALPAFSIVAPVGTDSQHNGYSMAQGDNWIGKIVSAIQSGPDWRSTAVFITWDDCGCFYDHMPPPEGMGIRLPMLIVSPYAKEGFTDGTPASGVSFLAFTEQTFGLPPLTTADANAYDYADAFDLTSPPRTDVPRMVATRIPRAERRFIARHPVVDDPT
jgi:phospholipase C